MAEVEDVVANMRLCGGDGISHRMYDTDLVSPEGLLPTMDEVFVDLMKQDCTTMRV